MLFEIVCISPHFAVRHHISRHSTALHRASLHLNALYYVPHSTALLTVWRGSPRRGSQVFADARRLSPLSAEFGRLPLRPFAVPLSL